MITETLDIDRLHEVIDGGLDTPYPRGQGRTTAFVALMIGEAQLGDPGNDYLYIGENQHWTKDVAHEFARVVKEEGFSVTIRESAPAGQVSVFVGDDEHLVKTFRFLSARNPNLERMLKGVVYDDIYIDLTHEAYDSVDPLVWHIAQSRKRLRI